MNTIGLVYNKGKHRYVEVGKTWMDYLEDDEKRKIMFARRKQQEREEQALEERRSVGYCTECYTLRCTNGKCPNGCDD